MDAIQADLEKILRDAPAGTQSMGHLQKELGAALRHLRAQYTALSGKKPEENWQQWLVDNYYILEGQAKQALIDFRGFRQKRFSVLFFRLLAVFADEKRTPTQPSVTEAVSAINALSSLGEEEFDFLFPALKGVFLLVAADACSGEKKPGEREKKLSHAVICLGMLPQIDFNAVTCEVSAVEHILLQDPANVYSHMEETSRRHYRHIAARIAHRCGVTEQQVALDVLACAKNATSGRRRHVGYYLMNHDPVRIAAHRRGIAAIACGILLTLTIAAAAGYWRRSILIALLVLLPFSELMYALSRALFSAHIPAAHLPRMQQNPAAPTVAVTVTMLLPGQQELDALRVRMEQLYFSNRADNLLFCLLADFKAGNRPNSPQDEWLLQGVKTVIDRLNGQYGPRFILFVRKRSYCKTQDNYCGWERKRGAITEFIRFMHGGETSVCMFAGPEEKLKKARYLFALDADTGLSFDCVNRMLSAAVHPLNRPVIGKNGIVVSGYAILMPRIVKQFKAEKENRFTEVMGGNSGISSYESERGEWYQDAFGQTIFTGKGLIDMDAFYKVLTRRFPENTVLSHDILEGAHLRTGLVSDIELSESAPANAISWFARLHRWVRGDWQNIRFLGRTFQMDGIRRQNPIGWLPRFFLIENLRRSLVPVFSFFCIVLACFTRVQSSFWLCILAFLTVAFSPLKAIAFTWTRRMGKMTVRRYFSRLLPRIPELLWQMAYAVLMLTQRTVVTLDAILRTTWRMVVSHKNLLEWTTAAQADAKQVTPKSVLLHSRLSLLAGACLLFFAPRDLCRLFGLCALCYWPMAVYSAQADQLQNKMATRAEREQILGWCVKMLGYYEKYANKKNHWLPPDNVQFSPVEAVAQRTSPTNIGMMLLSYLAARDMQFLDSKALFIRLTDVFNSIEKLETFHGNLYNWYATDDLRVLPERFVSAVDSANFLCALVALAEGVREYAPQEPKLHGVVERIEKILSQTDFSIFYDEHRRLLSIGIDEKGEKSAAHYDFLMSEARTASFYAIATRQVPYQHWRALSRAMAREGVYAGPVSWTGTMFEYFMPHLLLPAYEGSLLGEALYFALYCQKRRARQATFPDLPWGMSESGYFAFDDALNYQYKAHGVQRLGVKQGLDADCVVAPYATFLALPYDLEGSMKNLSRLEKLGAVGRYGFYEALDFTPGRAGGENYGIIRSYMAHHIGMSMVACVNLLYGNVMQKRFMRNPEMRAAQEFLQEKIEKDAVVYDQMKSDKQRRKRSSAHPVTEEHTAPCPQAPACTMLSNGSLTHLFTDTGVSFLRSGDTDVTRSEQDLLRHAQGIFALAHCMGETLTATAAPFYREKEAHSAIFTGDSVLYQARKGDLELSQQFSLDRGLSVERCTLTVHNHSATKAMAELVFYFEPVLARHSEYAAHPAFSKLFLTGGKDASTDTITFHRRHRDTEDGLFLSVGFQKAYQYSFTLRREEATPYPLGMENLLQTGALKLEGGTATPDGCCALRMEIMVPAHGQVQVTLLLSCAATKEESVGNLTDARTQKPHFASAPLQSDSMTGRLGTQLLPSLLFPCLPPQENTALADNLRGQDALWSLGLSGDIPIVLYDWQKQPDRAVLDAYLRFWRLMRLHRLEFDFCVLGPCAEKLPNGVHLIDTAVTDAQMLCTLRAAACAVVGSAEPVPPVCTEAFCPATLLSVEAEVIPQSPDRFDVVGGAYIEDRFYVERVTPLPFSHVLASPQFGCLLQDASLGCTWWQNARECRLTPWKNDIATGCDGEQMLLQVQGQIYDLCRGARAVFSPAEARYLGIAGNLQTTLRVRIDEKRAVKVLDVSIENKTDEEVEVICAYGMEPVLGVSRLTSKFIQFEQERGCLLLHNPYEMHFDCYAAVCVPGIHPSYLTDRAAFYSGQWAASELLPNNDPIAGTLVRKRLPPRRREDIRFILAAAPSKEAAIELACTAAVPQTNAPPVPAAVYGVTIQTPSEPLNRWINTFAPHQIKAGRLYGRCGFYQSSGAYGFRDQLQDVGSLLLTEPWHAQQQILRCCAAQFWEGDVLHWWHALPDGTRGVRTRFSDDLLWLPYTVCDYLDATEDYALLDLKVPYCEGELLADGEQERYFAVKADERAETVYQHCIRTIEHALGRMGDKGLPLIGCGDWNDGFSNVGAKGRGQSVWLAMFFSIVLERFAPVCERKGDNQRAQNCRTEASRLRHAVDQNAWDGRWYLRAFYDDGTPLGGRQNNECRIDLLSQAFSVLSHMPDAQRVQSALDAALHYLVDETHGIVKLFSPPFDTTEKSPGYIKAYPTGIRENGGQYTHAAVWLARALLCSGRAEEGWQLLDMLGPTARCTAAKIATEMKTEPYYIAADIYTHSGCYGHGGWTIYTGAAAWYYRTVLDTLLGLRRKGDILELSPCIPADWAQFSVRLKTGEGDYEIEVRRTGKRSLMLDDKPVNKIFLNRGRHNVLYTL